MCPSRDLQSTLSDSALCWRLSGRLAAEERHGEGESRVLVRRRASPAAARSLSGRKMLVNLVLVQRCAESSPSLERGVSPGACSPEAVAGAAAEHRVAVLLPWAGIDPNASDGTVELLGELTGRLVPQGLSAEQFQAAAARAAA